MALSHLNVCPAAMLAPVIKESPLGSEFLGKKKALVARSAKHVQGSRCVGRMRVMVRGGERVRLHLSVEHQVQFGESVGVLGSTKWLGDWKKPVEMKWREDGWAVEIEGKPGEEAEFKFVVCGGNDKEVQQWEDGPNRVLTLPSDSHHLKASAKWGHSGPLTIQDSSSSSSSASSSNGASASASSKSTSSSSSAPSDTSSAFGMSWQGREVSFMRSNEHSHQRRGDWNTTGLTGPALSLVEGDKRAGNWWRKLEVVQNLLSPLEAQDRLEALIYSSIYLQWINTGQITCVEDGGHYRPNKHANISKAIFRWMEKDSIAKLMAQSPQAVLVMRRMHPRLPAFTSEFTAAVPLTRIRDIAHRNDIPHDLKQEIKHTIQNKLHRCAGPEDLVATEMMLKRVTAQEGQYSAAFVEQLRIFYGELKDFFNASSLTDQLEAIRGSLDEQTTSALNSFLAAKKKVDELSPHGENDSAVDVVLAALHALTGIRAALVSHLSSGLRNDAPDDSIAMRQKWRLSEIGLEDYSFVLLSRLLNEAEKRGGIQTMSSEAQQGNPRLFDACTGAAVLALRQIGLSGWEQAECLCVENELAAWQKAGIGHAGKGGVGRSEDLKWWALRFKATLDRARRLTEGYSETVLSLFADPAKVLGGAMCIEENAVRTFAEAEIRASVVFQLDKLVSMQQRALRSVLGSEGWEVLMPGVASGLLRQVERIDPASLQGSTEDTILLVHRADGDEEVRAAGSQVRAVILLQELPHLSHLAVRARQERVPFVTCEDDKWIEELKSAAHSKQRVLLDASTEGVKMTIPAPEGQQLSSSIPGAAVGTQETSSHALEKHATRVAANKGAVAPLIHLADATLDTCGAKSASCAQLLNLATDSLASSDNQGAFYAPKGAVIPFGAMDNALKAAGTYEEYLSLVNATESAPIQDLDDACSRLRSLITGLSLSEETMSLLGQVFSESTRLIVRSSANVEDLAGMSGAGLYDSIPNVRLNDPSSFSSAVTSVWASLFSRRAVLSRRTAGVPQGDSSMAVLVQELMSPDISFVLHTKSLTDGATHEVHAEIAPGLGETLASGTRGTPWRVAVDKGTGEVSLFAMANFSEKLVVVKDGPGDGSVANVTVDYSKQEHSVSEDSLKQLAVRLSLIGQKLEGVMGSAQDIEGCLVDSNIIIVQSRPQP